MEEERYKNLKLGERGAIISLVSYICLSIIKLTAGVYTGSVALRADGLNNVTDIVVSIAVLIGLKVSQKPPDDDHPYGHWKAESVASLVASFIIMMVGIQVLMDAVSSFFNGPHDAPDILAAWVGGFSFVAMILVYTYNRNLAKKINSQAVGSVAKDNLSDALVSVGATLGIIGSQFGIPWLDPLLAVAVGLIICRTAWGIFRNSSLYLTDGIEERKLKEFKKAALSLEEVKNVKKVKARYYGNSPAVDLVIEVSHTLSLKDAHDISTKVEEFIKHNYQAMEVHVHIEPDKSK